MSGTFVGFSDDDIRKAKSETGSYNKVMRATDPKNLFKAKKPVKKSYFKKHDVKNKVTIKDKLQSFSLETIPENAKLSRSSTDTHENVTENVNENNNVLPDEKTSNKNCLSQETQCIDLTEFQTRQKFIEEQNKKRKELLVAALADRTKKTQEETERLNLIREEFKKLDNILYTDVKILRRQIEVASIDFLEAQKRYYKIEKEFLNAKLLMQQKFERKELLTEHLSTIIEKNEERKADKLTELLTKLNLSEDSIKTSAEQSVAKRCDLL